MDKRKAVALVGLVLGAVATAFLSSPYGTNPAIHTACDLALKVLAALGLTLPVSLLGGNPPAKPEAKE